MKPSDLEKAVMGELDRFAGMLPDDIATAMKKASKSAIKELRATSPGKKYGKQWKAQTTKTRTGAQTIIYQGERPGLVHLLEYGHPIVSGGRTVGRAKAFPHVDPAAENVSRVFEEELVKVLEK